MTTLPRLSLRRNFTWALAGNIIYAGSQWATVVVLAKLGPPRVVGQYSLGLAVTAPVFMFANMQLRAVQVTDVAAEYRFGDYLGLRIVGTAVALAVVVGIALFSHYQIETVLVVLAVSCSKAFEALSDIIYGYLQQHENMERIAKSMMIKGPMSLLSLGIVVGVTGRLVWGVTALAVVMALRLVTYDATSATMLAATLCGPRLADTEQSRGRLRPHFDPTTMGRLISLALPLGIVMMLISLNANMPRYFIHHYYGEAELGVFSALAYLNAAIDMVVGALGQAASPRLAYHFGHRHVAQFRSIMVRMVIVAASLGALAMLFAMVAGRPFLSFVYTSEYADRGNVFVWLVVAGGITAISSFLGTGATATRVFGAQVLPQLVVVAASATLSVCLIPTHGILGAAWVMCGSAVTECLTRSYVIVQAWTNRHGIAV